MGGIPCNYHGEVLRPRDGNSDSIVRASWAVGRGACVSVHGANRLGSTRCWTWLCLAAKPRAAVWKSSAGVSHKTTGAPDAADFAVSRMDSCGTRAGRGRRPKFRLEMQKTMQLDAAVFRTGESLNQGIGKLAKTFASFEDVRVTDRSLVWTPISSRRWNSRTCCERDYGSRGMNGRVAAAAGSRVPASRRDRCSRRASGP